MMAVPSRAGFGELKAAIHRKLLQKLNLERLTLSDRDAVRREVSQIIESLLGEESTPMTYVEREQLAQEVLDEVFGLGPLQGLLNDPTISDILVNSYKSVYIERNGLLEKTGVQFRDDDHLRQIIDRIW
jgi:pilus assembly protein CpaF